MVHPDEIARTANKKPKPSPGTNLGSIRPFENTPLWQPEPYQPGAPPPLSMSQGQRATGEATDTKSERDALDKASLVFVRNNTASATAPRPQESSPSIDLGIGLAPGTRLRARLESASAQRSRRPWSRSSNTTTNRMVRLSSLQARRHLGAWKRRTALGTSLCALIP